MSAFAYRRPVPIQFLRNRQSLVIGDREKRRSTGKIIACDNYGDAQGEILAADPIRR